MSGLRRAHHKSRTGCSQCKRRRVKCDQRPPTCGHCSRRGEKCSYEDLLSVGLISRSVPAPTPNSTSSDITFEFDTHCAEASRTQRSLVQRSGGPIVRIPAHEPDQPPPLAYSVGFGSKIVYPELRHLQDGELLHHFSTATKFTFVPRDPIDHHLHQLILPMAQSNEYVLHALLGTSALHLALLNPEANRGQYHQVALRHLHKARLAFQTTVNMLDPKNSNAIFAFSGMSIIWEFALLHPAYAMYRGEQHPIDRLIQVFNLLRNVMALWQSFPPTFYQAIPPKPRIAQGITNSHKSKTMESKLARIQDSGLVPSGLASMTQRLHDLNSAFTTDPAERQIYNKAIDLLHVTAYKVVKHPGEWTLALRWAFNLSNPFILLLQARRPLALVLLGHYCVLLHHGARQWWMRDWSKSMVSTVSRLLDEQWINCLSWAMQVVQDGHQSPFRVTDAGKPGDFVA